MTHGLAGELTHFITEFAGYFADGRAGCIGLWSPRLGPLRDRSRWALWHPPRPPRRASQVSHTRLLRPTSRSV